MIVEKVDISDGYKELLSLVKQDNSFTGRIKASVIVTMKYLENYVFHSEKQEHKGSVIRNEYSAGGFNTFYSRNYLQIFLSTGNVPNDLVEEISNMLDNKMDAKLALIFLACNIRFSSGNKIKVKTIDKSLQWYKERMTLSSKSMYKKGYLNRYAYVNKMVSSLSAIQV